MRRDASTIKVSLLFWIAIVGSIFLVAFVLKAESNRGSSDIGLCSTHYSYSNFIAGFGRSSIIRTGWLDNTFNARGCPNAVRLMGEAKPLDIRVHILNGPGLRNRRLEAHEIHAGSTVASLSTRIQRGDKFVARYRNRLRRLKELTDSRVGPMKLAISPCLECDFAKPVRRKLLRETARIFPGVPLVDNPLHDSCLSGYLCEKHGLNARGDIVDLDGDIVSNSQIGPWLRRNAKAKTAYVWTLCKNGFTEGETWKPPTRRTNFCTLASQRKLAKFLGE